MPVITQKITAIKLPIRALELPEALVSTALMAKGNKAAEAPSPADATMAGDQRRNEAGA